jgi:predicted MFS family arabinose efflux permease
MSGTSLAFHLFLDSRKHSVARLTKRSFPRSSIAKICRTPSRLTPSSSTSQSPSDQLWLNALSFLAPIITLWIIKARFRPEKTNESIFTSLKKGIAFARQQPAMEALIVLAFCMTFLAMPMRTYLPVFVKDIFHRGPETYGNLLSLMGIGSIFGSLLMAGLGNVNRKGRVALGGLILLGAGISGFAISKHLHLSGAMLVLVGAAMMAVFAMVNSLVQLITTNEMRGRVMSLYNFAFRGGMPMGNLLSGWLVPILSAPLVLGVNGLLLIAVALYFFLVQRRVAAL